MVTKCVPCYVFCTTYIILLYINKKDRKCCGHYSVDLWFCSVTKIRIQIQIKMNFQKGFIIADDTCFQSSSPHI